MAKWPLRSVALSTCIIIALGSNIADTSTHHSYDPPSFFSPIPFVVPRGGAGAKKSTDHQVFEILARTVQGKLGDATDREEITKALSRLASSQSAFKGLDGAAHEAYQRTHAGDDIDTSVGGRAQRSAARLGATSEALLACELVEIIQSPELIDDESLGNRKVLLNISSTTNSSIPLVGSKSHMSMLVLYEESYDGGSGLEHGSLFPQQSRKSPRGRLLVVLGDSLSSDLVRTIKLLDQKPQRVKLSSGLVTDEIVSVQSSLYKTAGYVLYVLEPLLRTYNTTAVHFVGQSLAGGVASLAATILDGSLPLPKSALSKKKQGSESANNRSALNDDPNPTTSTLVDKAEDTLLNSTETCNQTTTALAPINGLGRARSSALSLGGPPCLSSNVVAAFCTSFMYGDDIVCRTTSESIQRLCERLDKNINGGVVGRNMGWMTDTLSLTMSNLKSHAHGSEGEEIKLAIPGQAYLIRPRRLGGICSIHEVGTLKKGGREALRAGLLWQLNDILVSKSMWKHHHLDSYINGLDRVQLRGIGENSAGEMF